MEASVAPTVARLRNPEGGVVGGGALLGGNLVLTCAHVVNGAIGRPRESAQRPRNKRPQVDFPLQGVGPIQAEVVAWLPLGTFGQGDVAILHLRAVPDQLVPASLVSRLPTINQTLSVFGFPGGRPDGVWKTDGTYDGPLIGGWSQVRGSGTKSYRFQSGFSGCPLFNDDAEVVGMFAQADRDPAVDAGAFMPVSIIAAALQAAGEATLPIADSEQSLTSDDVMAFVGPTRRRPARDVLLTRWTDFAELLGQPLDVEESYLGAAVRGFFDNGGQSAYIVPIEASGSSSASVVIPTSDPVQHLLVEASDHGSSGNSLCVVIASGTRSGFKFSVGTFDSDDSNHGVDYGHLAIHASFDNLSVDETGLNPILRRVDTPDLSVAWASSDLPGARLVPGLWRLSGGAEGSIDPEDYIGNRRDGRGILHVANLADVGLACVPDADHARFDHSQRSTIVDALVAVCENSHVLAIVGSRPDLIRAEQLDSPGDSRWASAYFPSVNVRDPNRGEAMVPVTPVGHVGGAIARSDLTQGVHQALTNAPVLGLNADFNGPATVRLDESQCEALLQRGVNPLRTSNDDVVRLDRPVTTSIDQDWQRIEVVRTSAMIERRIQSGLAWTVFEPNGPDTWGEVERVITQYLTRLWERGVLHGRTAEEAFFVKCDDETMALDDIAAGRIQVQLGFSIAGSAAGASPMNLALSGLKPS